MSRDLLEASGWPKPLQMFLGIAVENWLRYALVACIAWLLAYVLFKKRWWRRKIIQKAPSGADVRREMKWSILTAFIYGLVGVVTILAGKTWGWQMYRKIGSHGWPWFITSIGIAIGPTEGMDADGLVKQADVAMYRAKSQGRNRYCVFGQNVFDAADEASAPDSTGRVAQELPAPGA